ncbi:TIGR03087 family PEP-CTERM/XrtA system glycosyltransferase [Altererythrobacter aerius]|uniref:TIGR03087 family PEP-CTERM/XrtA system glycosyltransferase n=1 Tax=Tsuneonella aeria TaxID=1837929 RepID=A0A6I4TAA7_9SPHN|nr:TIGR03087 family PEP-CTERM/XrtA system glycosyltransferase [Tsuneonella aeria]MXO74152.1 TIGR03087 family PEP-CTERM/XrtA system glycosyltransferase [Tsuneonella aeria]
MGETLFIAHRMPFPPERGDKIRSHHLLKALAALGPVHVATFAETAADYAAEPYLAEMAASHVLVARPRRLAWSGLKALVTGKPVSLTAFASDRLAQWIAETLRDRPIDTVFVFSGQMGQYIPFGFQGRVIVDLCDVDSAKFEAYGASRRGPRAWVDRRECRLLRAEEARLGHLADATLLVSEAEVALFKARTDRPPRCVVALGNGIDTAFFDPRGAAPQPELAASAKPNLLFTGQMDYAPNVAAVERMARAIMPIIRQRAPAVQFHVVGRAPTAAVRALQGVNGTRVWGEVPDVRPFLAAADVVVAPLAIARGVQNKVLEAMAMARPVVLTPEAATGIGGSDPEHYAIGDSDAALADRVLTLLADRQQAAAMGVSARRFVVAHKGWAAALAPLADLVGHAPRVRDAA